MVPMEYESLVTLISGKPELFQLEEIEGLMLAHETRIECNRQDLLGDNVTANLVQHSDRKSVV